MGRLFAFSFFRFSRMRYDTAAADAATDIATGAANRKI